MEPELGEVDVNPPQDEEEFEENTGNTGTQLLNVNSGEQVEVIIRSSQGQDEEEESTWTGIEQTVGKRKRDQFLDLRQEMRILELSAEKTSKMIKEQFHQVKLMRSHLHRLSKMLKDTEYRKDNT